MATGLSESRSMFDIPLAEISNAAPSFLASSLNLLTLAMADVHATDAIPVATAKAVMPPGLLVVETKLEVALSDPMVNETCAESVVESFLQPESVNEATRAITTAEA